MRATRPSAEPVDANLVTVLSPMVGIFYRAPSPNDPNFVEIGARVEVGQTLCLVETMKVFNEITCEWDGTVVEILAENSQLLETGDRLMVIRKS
jgi:acetyl-CoA carboxylase biotin carboxyl carrier protein